MTVRRYLPIALVFALVLGLGSAALAAQNNAAKEHAFKGKIEKVDAKAKTLTVNGEAVEGWMGAMTMTYAVDKEEVMSRVKAGDRITAKVKDGDFKTLYDVQVAKQ